MRSLTSWLAFALAAIGVNAAPFQPFEKRQDGGKLVFAHMLIGTQAWRTSAADYDNDMKRAKAAGIDAFALNIAKDTYTEAQLNYAYESAGNNGMKLFLSFDYNNGDIYFGSGDVSQVAKFITEFGSKDAQLKVDNKVFVSSFNGDDSDATRLDPQAIRNAAGIDLFIAPNFHPGKNTDISGVDGALSWSAWDSNGANRAPDANANITTSQSDATYTSWLGSKAYIAPVSPWFFTNYASKAWVFPSNLLWFRRWNEILALGPRFVEIVTWNDYGESHYIGAPPSEDHDSVSQAWSANMPHDGWLDMATPFITAFKSGAKTPAITEDKLVYWYRPSLKAGCQFDGIDSLEDAVFVVALLTKAGKLTITSGDNTQEVDAPAGASAHQVAMGAGKPSFKLEGGAVALSGQGGLEIAGSCNGGAVNLNAFVGVVSGSG